MVSSDLLLESHRSDGSELQTHHSQKAEFYEPHYEMIILNKAESKNVESKNIENKNKTCGKREMIEMKVETILTLTSLLHPRLLPSFLFRHFYLSTIYFSTKFRFTL
jgi:hypothetical protein